MEVRKNDIVKGKIIDINDDGQGVLKTEDGIVIFVPNTLPNEDISAHVINTKSKFKLAKVENFLTQSTSRVVPKCPYYLKCGGCDIMHLNQNSAVEFKTNKVKRAFRKIARLDVDVKPCIVKNEFRYRNKLALPLSSSGEIGLYRKNSHKVLPIDDCLITEEWNKELISVINDYLKISKISCYDDETKIGTLKHVVARKIDDQILVTLVVTNKNIPKTQKLIDLLKTHFNNFGLNLNINKLNNNVILSDEWIHLFGAQEIIVNEFGITYPVSNASFFQVNNQVKKAIYNHVLSEIPADATVIDAYSGAGLLSGIISKTARVCYGVEIVPEATANANCLKEKNNLTNLFNINGDCTKVIPELVKNNTFNNLIITLDPPRKGCDKKVLNAIIDASPDKIIYISCDPGTLARDAKIILDSKKYRVLTIQPYDMFPQTKHVETLTIFVKN